LSKVADFANALNDDAGEMNLQPAVPTRFASKVEKLYDIQAVIFDIYGTLINYWKPEFGSEQEKKDATLKSFAATVNHFELEEYLLKMDLNAAPEQTLCNLYQGLIALELEKKQKKDIAFPETRVDKIWQIILMMLNRHGYTHTELDLGDNSDVAKCMAYTYNYYTFNRGLFPQVVTALQSLRKKNIRLGIVANGQFYTPIDLTLAVRAQNNQFHDYRDFFDESITFFSYEYGVSTYGDLLFRKLYDALYEFHILPRQTVFVGNDLVSDIQRAQSIGMKTAFFTGNSDSTFTHNADESVLPDISFSSFGELAEKISFHGEGKAEK